MIARLVAMFLSAFGALRSRIMILLFLTVCIACYVIIVVSDTWIDDPLGGAILGNIPKLKAEHSQSAALLINSYSDISITVLLGLFLAAGFAIHRFGLFKVALPLSLKVISCLFGFSAILAFYFGVKLKTDFLIQLQFDRVNALLLQQTMNLHLLFLLSSALCGLYMMWAGMDLGPNNTDNNE